MNSTDKDIIVINGENDENDALKVSPTKVIRECKSVNVKVVLFDILFRIVSSRGVVCYLWSFSPARSPSA